MKEYKGYLYIHKCKITNKCYVGQTTMKMCNRWRNGAGYRTCPKFRDAIKKYGWNNFEHLVLPKIYDNCEELNQAEINMIKELDSMHNGYNCDEGGYKGCHIVSNETREKMRISHIGHTVSKETREKIIKNHGGGIPVGFVFSKEHNERVRLANIGRILTVEHRNKISKSNKGRVVWNKGLKNGIYLKEEMI